MTDNDPDDAGWRVLFVILAALIAATPCRVALTP